MFRILFVTLLFSVIGCVHTPAKTKYCDLNVADKNIAWNNIVEALEAGEPFAKRYYDLFPDLEKVKFYDYGDVCRAYPSPSKGNDAVMALDGDIGVEFSKDTLEVTSIFPVVCCSYAP